MRVIVSQNKKIVNPISNIFSIEVKLSNEVSDILNALVGNDEEIDYAIVINGSDIVGKFKEESVARAELRNIIDFILGEDSLGEEILNKEYQVNPDIDKDGII